MASHLFFIIKLNKINPNRISSAFFSGWLTNTSLTPMLQMQHNQKLLLPFPNLLGLNTLLSNALACKDFQRDGLIKRWENWERSAQTEVMPAEHLPFTLLQHQTRLRRAQEDSYKGTRRCCQGQWVARGNHSWGTNLSCQHQHPVGAVMERDRTAQAGESAQSLGPLVHLLSKVARVSNLPSSSSPAWSPPSPPLRQERPNLSPRDYSNPPTLWGTDATHRASRHCSKHIPHYSASASSGILFAFLHIHLRNTGISCFLPPPHPMHHQNTTPAFVPGWAELQHLIFALYHQR